MKRRIMSLVSLLLAIVMVFVLSACNVSKKIIKEPVPDSITVLAPNDQLSIVIGSHSSYPYNEKWLMWKYFREAIGGNVKVTSIPNTEINTKISLMMASPKELPDLIHTISKTDIDPYALSGALIAIDDNMDKMPNYKKFWDSIPKEERDRYLLQRVSGDGKTYFPQVYGNDLVMNMRTWMYRKDIFDKNGLKTPETLDEMYNVAVKLKKLYPDSYPVCMRTGLTNVGIIGSEWKPYFTYLPYYDYNSSKWCYGATEPTMREIVEYLIKLRNEKLIPPDYLTIKAKSWEELISTNRGFMMPEYIIRIDYFNKPNRQTNPEFTLAAMKAPRANTPTGQNRIAKLNMDPTGYVVCNTGNQQRIDNALKVLDWMYSDEASELLSWGKSGETYEETNGERHFLLNEGEQANQKFGLRTYGLYQRVDPKSSKLAYSKEQMDYIDFINKNSEEKINPTLWLSLNEEEAEVANDLGPSIQSFAEEMLSKFLLGQKSMSEWDAFQKELKNMGTDKLLSVYESAYKRINR